MIMFTVVLESTPRAKAAVIYLRLYVYQTHLVLGLNGADGLYTGPIQIFLILSILYKSADKSGYDNWKIYFQSSSTRRPHHSSTHLLFCASASKACLVTKWYSTPSFSWLFLGRVVSVMEDREPKMSCGLKG